MVGDGEKTRFWLYVRVRSIPLCMDFGMGDVWVWNFIWRRHFHVLKEELLEGFLGLITRVVRVGQEATWVQKHDQQGDFLLDMLMMTFWLQLAIRKASLRGFA